MSVMCCSVGVPMCVLIISFVFVGDWSGGEAGKVADWTIGRGKC